MKTRISRAVIALALSSAMPAIAQTVAATGDLPGPVASVLHVLLDGNVKKVMISVALWSPYLLLSRRVNITFRHRLPA